MPTYQTVLLESIYLFLEKTSKSYSGIEKYMHVALMRGKSIATVEKKLQAKRRVDSTTTRNVYHNITGKYLNI